MIRAIALGLILAVMALVVAAASAQEQRTPLDNDMDTSFVVIATFEGRNILYKPGLFGNKEACDHFLESDRWEFSRRTTLPVLERKYGPVKEVACHSVLEARKLISMTPSTST